MRHVQIQTTSICNARCLICPYPHSYLARNKAVMEDSVFDAVIRSLKESSFTIGRLIMHLQAEPLTDPKLFDRIRRAKDTLAFDQLEVSTNCSLLDEKKANALIEALEGCKAEVWLSFHETDKECFERMTGLSWEICKCNLDRFLRLSDSTEIARRVICRTPEEYKRFYWESRFAELALKRRPHLSMYPACGRAGNVRGEYAKEVRILGNAFSWCPRLHDWLHVNWRGEVVPCCMDYEQEVILGSVLQEPLDGIVAGIVPEMVRRAGDNPDFLCRRCDELLRSCVEAKGYLQARRRNAVAWKGTTARRNRISFCVTCMGRLHHLRKTLPKNILWNRDYEDLEFILLDYNSPDGLEDWVKRNMMGHIRSGRLVYCKETSATHFILNHARNMAARVSTGDIVCCVDADNLTGSGFAAHLNQLFGCQSGLIVTPPRRQPPGTGGRIALRKEDLAALGGFDERFVYGWGVDDADLVERAVRMGLLYVSFDEAYCVRPIFHSDAQRARHARLPDVEESAKLHADLSRDAISRGVLVANKGKRWGAGVLVRNFSDRVEVQ